MKSPVITTRTEKLWLEDGIIHINDISKDKHTLEDAVENGNAVIKLAAGKKVPMLLKGTKISGISREAKIEYSRGEHTTYVSAGAYMISNRNRILKVICNFIVSVTNRAFPARVFTSEKEATVWLKTFI